MKQMHKKPPRNATGLKGVYKASKLSKKPFRARIYNPNNLQFTHLGTFDTAEEAAKAYDKAAWELHGADSYYNFIKI